MLLLLAWMLWLYRRPVGNDDEIDPHPNIVATNLEQTRTGPPDEKPFQPQIIEEEIFQTIDSGVHQSVYNNDFDDGSFNEWDPVSSNVKEARILKQQSIVVGSQGNEACVIDERNQFVGVEPPFVEAKKATLASQPSIKRDRAKLYSPNSSFTPVKRSTQEKEFLAAGNDGEESERKTSTSSMNILIRRDTIVAPNEVSCFEGELQNNRYDIHPPHHLQMEDGDSDEDNEVAQAFLESRAEPEGEEGGSEEEMQYTTPHGTKITINHEAAGRIHSIVVKDKKQQPKPKPKVQKNTKIRIASPRMRATSPRVRAENISPTIISMSQDDLVHLVVETNQPDSDMVSREHVVVPEPIIMPKQAPKTMAKPPTPTKTKPPTPTKPKPPSPTKKQNNVGKLPPQPKKFKDPNFLDKHKKQVTDFDAIMNKRKKFVDTMDDAGRLLGQIAHRDEKLAGGRRELSKHWLKIKDAVHKRQYLKFNDKPMR